MSAKLDLHSRCLSEEFGFERFSFQLQGDKAECSGYWVVGESCGSHCLRVLRGVLEVYGV